MNPLTPAGNANLVWYDQDSFIWAAIFSILEDKDTHDFTFNANRESRKKKQKTNNLMVSTGKFCMYDQSGR